MRQRIGLARVALWLYCLVVLAFLIVPLVVIFPLSFSAAEFLQFPPPEYSLRWYESYFTSRSWMASTLLSLKVAVTTALLALAVGVPASFYLARSRTGAAVWVADKLLISPIVIPGMVTAICIYSLMSSWRMIGSFHGLVLGHLVLALPFVVIIVTAALRQFDRMLEDAADGLGAGRLRAILLVTFPVLRPSFLTAGFFAFMASFDDLVLALFLSGSNATLPKKTFENIGYALDPTIAAVSALQIGFLIAVSLLWYLSFGRRSLKALS
ncbi:ABC transporter permease subunit [Paracoccus sp. S-4012]|uniref:ABC transporter permease n=1 Tax=Paracoccus sp. S-4012 TaxID=2665648 RepID=UPI0012B0AD5F|nr:ABC transporter permease [Paracoccus sp. S-4012]MRX52309.1 ABC transporter permease subunit [Paracoccus sp. S-4012]